MDELRGSINEDDPCASCFRTDMDSHMNGFAYELTSCIVDAVTTQINIVQCGQH